ncbi:putative la-type HTH domain, nucleotide-binding alpha-beta plait domain superfamily [Plasmopara halstedii]
MSLFRLVILNLTQAFCHLKMSNPDNGNPTPLPSFAADDFLSSARSPYSRNNNRLPADRSDEMDVMAQLASQYYIPSRNRSFSAPIHPSALGPAWNTFTDDSSVSAATQHHFQNQNQPLQPHQPPLPQGPPPPMLNIIVPPLPGDDISVGAIGQAVQSLQLSNEERSEAVHGDSEVACVPLPATFLRTICDQLEYYFCDENLLGDLFLLKNMNMDGYVKLDLLASFGRVKKLTTDMDQIKKALELSTKLILNEDETMVCRKEPLAPNQTYHGKLARTAIAYNLPEDASVATLRETFQGCGEISYLRLLKQNTTTGRNAVLKPPIAAGETYAIIEFVDDEMTKHAVLTLSDQYNWRTGMQVVLFDGTNCDKLKQKMFPVELGGDRRRAKSASAITRPVHVESVGEGLDDLREGKVNTGTVYSIRGAGGLITPARQDSACISFRLIPDEDGNVDIRQGDYVSFTVGKNKKSGRKYASKVKLEFRPPANLTVEMDKDYFSPSPSRWESRSRAATVGAPSQPTGFRTRSSSSNTRPKLSLSSPRMSQSPVQNTLGGNLLVPPPGIAVNGSTQIYRQAIGPDGTRGFGFRRTGGEPPEMASDLKFPVMERRRTRSSGGAW